MATRQRSMSLAVPVLVAAAVLAIVTGGAGAGAASTSGAGAGSAAAMSGMGRWSQEGSAPAVATTEPTLPGVRVLLLREVYTDAVTFIDVGDPGQGIGDYVIFQDPVQGFHSGEPLGYMDVQCFIGYSDLCRGTFTLTGDGQIEFEGANPSGVKTTRYAITGGTGIYGDVRGKVVVTFPTKESARIALHLIGA